MSQDAVAVDAHDLLDRADTEIDAVNGLKLRGRRHQDYRPLPRYISRLLRSHVRNQRGVCLVLDA